MTTCKIAVLTASIALALGTTAAFAAAPAATQLPGQGKVVSTGTAPTVGTITSGGAQTIGLNSNTVIDWGVSSGATINTGTTAQPGGFNVGSSAALTFNDAGNSVLNVDVSGNPSQIMGALNNTGAGNVFVANSNGIIVGAGASISTNGGDVGLIANTLSPTVGTDFQGTMASIAYDGAGGNVTVLPTAAINGASVLVSGGGTVNVDLGNITNTGDLTIAAGLPSGVGFGWRTTNYFTTTGFSTINANAALNVTGTLPSGGSFAGAGGLLSGGDITTSGTVDVGEAGWGATAGGTLTNNGALTWGHAGGSTIGDVVNNGAITLTGSPEIGGTLINNGQVAGVGHVIFANGVNNAGSIAVDVIQSKGDFTNSGDVSVSTTGTFPVTTGNGSVPAAITVIGGNLTNAGQLSAANVSVTGGDFNNTGTMSLTGDVSVTNGSIMNKGTISGAELIQTFSDASQPSFTAGSDYSITNAGTITAPVNPGLLFFDANDQFNQSAVTTGDQTLNGSTGSFTNTGTLQVPPLGGAVTNNHLRIGANNDISLGGTLQTNDGAGHVQALSATNPLYFLALAAGNSDYNFVMTTGSVVTLNTDVTTSEGSGDFVAGDQVKLMSNLSVAADSTGTPTGSIDIVGGAAQPVTASIPAYAIRVAAGKTISAGTISIDGDQAGDNPNVILQGTLAASEIILGGELGGSAVSDVFSGPAGAIDLSSPDGGVTNPYLYINATGRVKTAPYLNDANNFRYNYLPVTTDGSPLNLEIDPTNMQGTPKSGVNLLVNSDVNLVSDLTAAAAGAPSANGSAVTGVTNVPNSHFVLQSTGNITTGDTSVNAGAFYWPGYIYLGNINSDPTSGAALPGTLGLGTITTTGNFNNVLPGDIAGASGIHFITQFPMSIGGDVVTNANAWVNFGTDLLMQAYSGGTLPGNFFGGVQGSSTVVNYGPLDPANFVTQAPVSTR